MYEKDYYWDRFWSTPSFSFFNNHYNIVNTSQYDIINGEKVERKEYRINRLKQEKESLSEYIKHCEKAIVDYSKRIEEIDKELKD
jgi:predicted RNase H-like nuclease (RuvC/YqgF family)